MFNLLLVFVFTSLLKKHLVGIKLQVNCYFSLSSFNHHWKRNASFPKCDLPIGSLPHDTPPPPPPAPRIPLPACFYLKHSLSLGGSEMCFSRLAPKNNYLHHLFLSFFVYLVIYLLVVQIRKEDSLGENQIEREQKVV